VHGVKVQASAGKQILEQLASSRRLGVEREKYPMHVDVEIPLEPFNTPGTEIAPGSDEVGEHFQFDRFAHATLSMPNDTENGTQKAQS
jgi:hypothetical protein